MKESKPAIRLELRPEPPLPRWLKPFVWALALLLGLLVGFFLLGRQ